MLDKIEALAQKIENLGQYVETLKAENDGLRSQNEQMQSELTELREKLRVGQLESADRNETVKNRLANILNRLDELEQIAR